MAGPSLHDLWETCTARKPEPVSTVASVLSTVSGLLLKRRVLFCFFSSSFLGRRGAADQQTSATLRWCKHVGGPRCTEAPTHSMTYKQTRKSKMEQRSEARTGVTCPCFCFFRLNTISRKKAVRRPATGNVFWGVGQHCPPQLVKYGQLFSY